MKHPRSVGTQLRRRTHALISANVADRERKRKRIDRHRKFHISTSELSVITLVTETRVLTRPCDRFDRIYRGKRVGKTTDSVRRRIYRSCLLHRVSFESSRVSEIIVGVNRSRNSVKPLPASRSLADDTIERNLRETIGIGCCGFPPAFQDGGSAR